MTTPWNGSFLFGSVSDNTGKMSGLQGGAVGNGHKTSCQGRRSPLGSLSCWGLKNRGWFTEGGQVLHSRWWCHEETGITMPSRQYSLVAVVNDLPQVCPLPLFKPHHYVAACVGVSPSGRLGSLLGVGKLLEWRPARVK